MVFEFGVEEGQRCLAMEYVPGEDLDLLIRTGALAQTELVELLAQACDGLGYAYEREVVHRDIKPANSLLI